MKELSRDIRRAAARWLFTDRDMRMHYVAEEYGFGGRTADVIGYTRAREEVHGIYRRAVDTWMGTDGKVRQYAHKKRVDEKVTQVPAEVRIVEVKISRADLLSGIRKGQVANDGNGLGTFADFCYLAGPRGLITARDLPDGWGVLEYDERAVGGGMVFVSQKPTRLTPSHPLTANERLAHQLAQSALWRLYGFGRTAPEELDPELEREMA